jgi:hypothetical protein
MRLMAWILLMTFMVAQPAGAGRQRFVSPDGVFRFSYTADFLLNTEENADEVERSYIPVCSDGAVCVVSRRSYFAGTTLQAASFQEREIADATTRVACLKGPPEDIPQYRLPKSDRKRLVGGLTFRHWQSAEVGLGNGLSTDYYRVFHGQKCYELSLNIAESSFANFDPDTIKEFTRDDEAKVMRDLRGSLNSFRFLK